MSYDLASTISTVLYGTISSLQTIANREVGTKLVKR